MKSLGIGLIGAGARAIAICKYISENPSQATLKVITDVNLEKAKELVAHFRLNADIQKSYDELIIRDDIDAVIVTTPDYLHVDPVISAMKASKNVYIEKPLATSLEDCDKIIEVSNSSSSICYLGFNMRHSPVHEKIYNLIGKGKLGKLTTIEANEWYYGGKTYFRRWNRLSKYSGGLWLTKASHDFDLITWIAGAKPNKIYATSSLSNYKPIEGVGPRCRDCKIKDSCPDYYDIYKPIEDNSFNETWRQLQLKMDQTGPMAPDLCLFNSQTDTFDNGIAVLDYENDIRATYTVNVLAAKTTRQISVIGTEGMAEGDMETGLVIFTERHSGKVIQSDLNKEIKGSHGGADSKILKDFFNICRIGGNPRSSLNDGRLAVQISIAARQSCELGTPIKI